LTVSFTDQSSGAPTSWAWSFGDSGASSLQNPDHVYQTPGVYTVSLTATNDVGSDTMTRTDYITVTEPGSGGGDGMRVSSIAVSRKTAGPNVSGLCTVVIVDANDQPVSSATVTVAYDGPNSGTLSALTGSNGAASFETGKVRNPSGEWCFEVTDVTHASLAYDAAANVVTRACESGAAYGADQALAVPREFSLGQNQPNPFNPLTEIVFSLPRPAYARLAVYDVSGALVATLVDGALPAGEHGARWDARDRPSGVYFYRLQADGQTQTRKMILVK
jgi:PKD repeat protein